MTTHAQKAAIFLSDDKRADWQNQTLWTVRENRDKAANSVPEWEQLREQSSQIKENVLSDLDNYLIQFETKATSLQAKALDGSYGGFQPKPAVEVIIVAMKPLSEKTYVDQALSRVNEEEQILNEIKEEVKKQQGIEIKWE